MKYLIDDAASLAALTHRQLPFGITQITLGGPFADDDLQQQLNTAYFACGCEEGSIAILAALMVSVYGALTTGLAGPFSWWRIAVYLGIAALGGKVVGLGLARMRLHRLSRQLAAIRDRVPHAGAVTS